METEAKAVGHTPGPWICDGSFVYALTPMDGGPGEVNRFSTSLQRGYNCTHAEAEANARLIAAAPDLLEALRDLVDATGAGAGMIVRMTAVGNACAAIARATQPESET